MPDPQKQSFTQRNRGRVKRAVTGAASGLESAVHKGVKAASDRAYELMKKLGPSMAKKQKAKSAVKPRTYRKGTLGRASSRRKAAPRNAGDYQRPLDDIEQASGMGAKRALKRKPRMKV